MSKYTEEYILNEIQEHNYKLLGQIEVDDYGYDELLNYLSNRAEQINPYSSPHADLRLSLALVQLAIHRFDKEGFWHVLKEETQVDLKGGVQTSIGEIFLKTLRTYSLFYPKCDGTSKQYVEYIKAHAFVTDAYMSNFFDFAYAYFEDNLSRQIPKNIDDRLKALSLYMSTKLNDSKDTIQNYDDQKKAKTYKLLKSTRADFAQCEIESIKELFLPTLKLIYNYFWDDYIPHNSIYRLERHFEKWVDAQNEKEKVIKRDNSKNRALTSHHPYITVDIETEKAFLIIPRQNFKVDECDGHATAQITTQSKTFELRLSLSASFGEYYSQPSSPIPIDDPFSSISIVIKSALEKKYVIKQSDYRIFNDYWESINHFSLKKDAHNFILTKLDAKTHWENENDCIESYDMYNWVFHSAYINEDSVFYVNGRPISIIGEFSFEPVFEYEIKNFKVINSKNEYVKATREHPVLSFTVDKDKLSGSFISINHKKYRLDYIKEKNCFEYPQDNSKAAISIDLTNLIEKTDGKYNILLDIPNEPVKKLCEYVLLTQLDLKFLMPIHIYSDYANLLITNCKYNIVPTDTSWKKIKESTDLIEYSIPINSSTQKISFNLLTDDTYTIETPVKIFKYGFSPTELRIKDDYIWYSDLREILYIEIYGAIKVEVSSKKFFDRSIYGEHIRDNLFRIDISSYVNHINKSNNKFTSKLYIRYTTERFAQIIELPPILRLVKVSPYFNIFKDEQGTYTDVKLTGDAGVCLDILDSNNNLIIENKKIVNGRNELNELEKLKSYILKPHMEEFDLIFSTQTPMPKRRCFVIDKTDLSGLPLSINEINCEEAQEIRLELNYKYFLIVKDKIDDDSYSCELRFRKLINQNSGSKPEFVKDSKGNIRVWTLGNACIKILDISNHHISFRLSLYSKEDNCYMSPYYNKIKKKIISPDNEELYSTKNYNDFLELYEEATTFTVKLN